MSEQVTDGRLACGRTQCRIVTVKSHQYLKIAKCWDDTGNRLVELQFTLFDQLHRRHRRDRFRHRSDTKDRIDGHRRCGAQVPLAKCTFVNNVLVVRGYSYNTGNITSVRRTAQDLINGSLSR